MDSNNIGKNTTSIIKGGSIISGTVVVRTGVSVGIKAVSWALLPVTCIAFGTWSLIKVDKDCKTMLELFKGAYSLRFKTLNAYIKSFRKAIDYLKSKGAKIIEEDLKEN